MLPWSELESGVQVVILDMLKIIGRGFAILGMTLLFVTGDRVIDGPELTVAILWTGPESARSNRSSSFLRIGEKLRLVPNNLRLR